jgi:hypothetical protein
MMKNTTPAASMITSAITLTTPTQIDGFRCAVIHKAIGFYLKTGMKVNGMYTPTMMALVASEYTGARYARGRKGLEQAYADLGRVMAGNG